jgi:hypothetical protein
MVPLPLLMQQQQQQQQQHGMSAGPTVQQAHWRLQLP